MNVPRAIRITCAVAGALLVLAAGAADGPFFERHVLLPYYFVRPASLPVTARATLAAAGVALAVLLGPALAYLARRPGRRPSVTALAVAVVAGLLAAEGGLRALRPGDTRRFPSRWELKVCALHPRYGWAARPGEASRLEAGGQPYTYAVSGDDGRRVRALGDRRDDRRPALIVIGESIAAGYGLDYDQTFAAAVGRALGLEVVDVADGGYAPDQAYLRLVDTLPRVSHPVAVVSTFLPIQLGRMLHDGYPRLAIAASAGAGPPALALEPPARGLLASLRLRDIVHNRLPYASDAALERALATTGAVLRATAAAARARGAEPLFVIPSHGPPRPLDAHPEAWIVRALFADAALPYVLVDLDPADVIPRDGHPNARGAAKIAAAIQAALHDRLASAR